MNDNINKIQKILQNKVGYQGSSADLMKYVENPENKEKLVKVLNTKIGYKGTVDDFNSYVGIQVPKVEGIQNVTAPSISVGTPEVNVMSPLVSNVPTTPKVDWATQEEGSMVKPIAGELEREQPVDFVGMTPDPKNDPDYSVINQSGKFVYTFDKEKSDRRKEKDAFLTILDEQMKESNKRLEESMASVRKYNEENPYNPWENYYGNYSGAIFAKHEVEKLKDKGGKGQGDIWATQAILKDAEQAFKAPKKGENWAKSFGIGGAETVTDPDAWLFGILSLNEVQQSMGVFEKVEKGEPLTDTESALMDAMLTRTQAEAMRSSDTSNWYKGGKVAGEALPFMRDMAMTGGLNTITTASGKGAVALAQRATAKYLRKKAQKQLLKEGIDITEDILSKRAADLFMRTAKVADYSGRLAADLTITPALKTPLQATAYAEMGRNMQGRVVGNEFGTYQIEKGDNLGIAAAKTFMSRQSEGVGTYFNPALKGLKFVGGKLIPKAISSTKLGQFGGKMVDFIIQDNSILQKAGISGYLGENLEEVYESAANYVLGLSTKEDLKSFYTSDNLKAMLIGTAPMSALGVAGNAINYGSNEVQYRRAKKELGGITDELDNSSVGELGNKMLEVLVRNNAFDEKGNLTKEGNTLNQNMLSYAQRKMAKDIANDGKQENPNSRYYDFLLNDRSKKWLESYLADNDLTAPMYFNLAYKATLHENELTDYERKTLSELDKAFNGYLKAEDDAQQASAEIDDQVNPTNNKIQNVTIGGQPYTVKGGNLAMTENEEGKAILDKENSDQVITVVNAEGIPSQIGIEQLESIVGEVDADEAKNAAIESAHTTAYNETFYPVGSIVYRKDAQGQFSAIKETGADGFTINSVSEGGEAVPTLIENTNSENFGVISLKAGDKYILNDGTQLDIISNEGGAISASVNGQPSEQTTADELATLFESTGIDLAQFEPVVEDVVETPETEVQVPGAQVEETQETEQPEATYPTDKKGEPIFEQMPVEQSVKVVREVLGDDTVDFVEDKIKAANKVVKSVSKKTPKSMSLLGRKAEVEAIALEKQKAAESLDYWTNVKRLMSEEAIQATREQTPINQVVENPNQVGQVIIDRYESAKKVIGNPATITAPNGKVLKGRYVLVSAYSVTPSHNPFDDYNTSEGFPLNADGSNTNKRDYKNDKANQIVSEWIGSVFGGQALENVPKVSKHGVVFDGSGRTIASQLAATNGTDKAYLEALNNNAANYGFTASDLKSISNPRIVFELETELPYTTESFDMFNSEEKKSESATASAVGKSKQLSPSAVAKIAALVDSYSSLESFFSSETATAEMVKTLVDAKVINNLEIAKLIDNGLFSATGRELIINVLLGATLNEQAIRQIGNDSSLKGIIVRAMKQILENAKLKEYSLFEDINNAISLMYEARKAKMAVSEFLLQTNMFEKGASERFSDFEQMLALAMSNSGVLFKGTIDKYNTVAAPLVGGQVDMFTGRIMDPNEVKQQIIEYYGKTKSIINPNAGVDGRNRSSETARTDSGRISLESAQAKFDAAITTEEMYKAALEITLILDEQNNTTTIVAKDNEEFISMLPAKYAEAIRKERVMGVFFKGQVIINSEKFDTGEEILLTYEHEWAHSANRNVHSSDELAELWNNSTDKKVLPRVYLGYADNIKGDELIAHIIEDIIQKQGYENYKNGNIDLSLYSQQEQLKKTIDYANKEYLRNVRGGDSRGNLHEDNNARKADEDLQQADEGRQTPKFRQKDDGTSGQVERNVQENVSQGGGRVRKAVTTETLLIDGVERPTRNSNGAYIHSTEEGVRNFYAWFGDSKVVDAEGRPLVVYHGSEANKKFNIFNPDRTNWFTPTKNYAKAFGDKLMFEVYVKAENPLYVGNIDGIANNNAMQRLSDDSGVSVDKLNGILKEENGGNIFYITNSKAFKDLMIEKGYDSLEANEAKGLKTFGVFSPSQIKSATNNTGEFSNESNDIRYKIIGEQGASALDKAEEATTRLDNLQVAKEMEATKTPAEIRLATGWERGADGLWRYEVPDSKNINSLSSLKRKEIEGREYIIDKLNNLVNDPKLFEAYPELNDVDVVLYNFEHPDYTSGEFRSKSKSDYFKKNASITLWNVKYSNDKLPESKVSTLFHEIQHAIQNYEGFAQGGNEGTVSMKDRPDNPKWAEWNSEQNQAKIKEYKSIIETKEYLNERDENNKLFTEEFDPVIDKLGEERTRENNKEISDKVQAVFDEFYKVSAKKFPTLTKADKISKDMIYHEPSKKISGQDIYRRLAGEVESRNVQSRMNMTPGQRRETLLSETEDVAREDQIFLYESLTAMNEMIPETITINGVERPTTNSNGKPIAQTEEGIRNFWRWFGNSKVTDESGRPLVVYHGSGDEKADFSVFSNFSERHFFTDNYNVADSYLGDKEGSGIYEVYLKIETPEVLEYNYHNWDYKNIKGYKGKDIVDIIWDIQNKKQNDGAIAKNIKDPGLYTDDESFGNDYIVFSPSQIKSATDNTGEFSESSDDIRFKIIGERGAAEYELAQKVREILKLRGIDKNFSVSNTDFGNSMYFTVYGENLNEPKLKVRISDHSVSNKDRIFGEQHENAKSDPVRIANDIELAMYPERYNKIENGVNYYSKYNNQRVFSNVENGEAWVKESREMNEKELNNLSEEKARVINKEFIRESASGNKLYKVELERKHEVFPVQMYRYERKETAPELNDPRFSIKSPIGFYSTVENALDKIQQEKGTKEQFKAMLLKNGAKQAEMDWMGWDDQFPDARKKVSKEKQLDIIQNTNPMRDDYHVGIRKLEDIKTFDQVVDDPESFVYGDFSKEDAQKALKEGSVTVYSSTPIKNGAFVSTSEKQAKDYAGNGKVYSQKVNLSDVAWINGDEGQIAKVDNTITKADIQRWIDQNRIEVQEVEKGKKQLFTQEHIDEIYNGLREEFSREGIIDLIDNDPNNPLDIWANNPTEENYNNLIEFADFNDINFEWVEEQSLPEDPTKYSQYTLPGGENYKELLLTMPAISKYDESKLPDDYRLEKSSNGNYVITKDGVKLQGTVISANKEEVLASYFGGKSEQFQSHHFDEPNILAHVRFNERIIPAKGAIQFDIDYDNWVKNAKKGEQPDFKKYGNDERVLFIEEFQSDWSQKGKKEGFKGTIKELPNNYGVSNMGENFYIVDMNNPGGYIAKGESYDEAKANALEILNNKPTIIPDMPFKKTDQWLNLAARRMMRYAAENGFDRIAWTNGEQQADRYDLSKQVDDIWTSEYSDSWTGKQYEKLKDVEITLKGGSVKKLIINESGKVVSGDFEGESLDNIVGKEIAEKIINAKEDTNFGKQDLKVGGEGMIAFYDAIVPSAMSKLGKPFGAKVESIEIDTKRPDKIDVEDIYLNGENVKSISPWAGYILNYNNKGTTYSITENDLKEIKAKHDKSIFNAVYSEREEKQVTELVNSLKVGDVVRIEKTPILSTQQSIPVTESMKESVMEGVPLFAIKAPKFEKGASLKEMVATSNMFIAARADKYGAKGRRMVESEIKTVGKAINEQSANLKESANLVTDMVKALLNNGSMNYMTRAELSQILTNVRNASNKKDLTKEFDKISSIVRQIQLRNAKRRFNDLMKFKVQDKNAKGISIASTVDDETVSIITTIRKSLKELTLEDVENQINEINNLDKKTTSDEIKLVGLGIARDYMNEIKTREAQLSQLAEELSKAKEELVGKKGEDRLIGTQLANSIEVQIGQVKAEMTSAYDDLSSRLNKIIAEGKEALKNIKLQDKENVEEIRHDVNSDMKGIVPVNNPPIARDFKQWLKSNFIVAPLQSFDYMLRSLAPNQVAGDGYLHDRFARGILSASQNAYEGTESAFKMIDEAVAKIFGDKFTFRYVSARDFKKMSKYELTYGTEKSSTTITATNGQLAYIYAVNKMTDGAMKLRAMGISEEQVEEMKAALPVRIVKLVDAIQDEILPKLRVKYNNTHLEIFNTSMDAIENYFPLKIDKTSLHKKMDLEEESTYLSGLIKNSTNSIIKRKVNTRPIDIRNSDFADVLTEHIKDMEEWSAYAKIRRDLNILLSNSSFTNRLIAIGGFKYLVQFKRAAAVAANVYQPSSDSYDTAITGVSRTVATSKVMLNLNTAFKQALAIVAYLTEPSPKFQGKVLVNLVKGHASFKWAKDNLPDFRKRWESSALGDEKLSRQFANIASEGDFVKFMDASQKVAQKYGMYPNKLVDSYICAVGAKSLYETNYDKYISMGATEEMARERALVDAVNLYNTTQQSSESMFVSSVQLDRTFFSTAYTVFNNASLAYNRQVFDAARNLKNAFNNRANLIENRTKFNVRTFNISEEAAKKAAVKEVDTQIMRDVLRVAVFGYGVQLIWRLGAPFVYLLFGDDDDKKKRLAKEAATGGALITPIRGLLFGATFESVIDGLMEWLDTGSSYAFVNRLTGNIHPIISDVDQLARAAVNKNMNLAKAGYLLVNLGAKLGWGIDLKPFANATYGFVELIDSDELTANDVLIDIMSMLSVPQSQLKALALDNPETFFDRYIELKELVDYGLLAPVLELNPDDLDNYIESGRRYIRRDMKEKSEKQP